MSGKNVNFEDKKIKRGDFYKNKKVTKTDDIDVNNDVIRPLCIKLSQMSDFVRKFEGNTIMSFKIIDKCYKSTIKYGKGLKNFCK